MTTVVPHKYMAGELSDEERAATFAARRDLLDYLVGQMRSQIGCGTLKSFLLTGPRGAGKTTLVHMLRQRIQADPELAAAWLPLVLPEEQTGVSSLRDLLVLILEHLEPAGVPDAAAWWQRAEQEADDELSRALAEDGLRTLAGSQGRRLVVVLENLVSLFERALGEDQQSTLRRLLMHEPFMLLVGTAVGTFDDLERYDRAFWKYFEPLRLEPLSDDDVHALLTRRAEYDGNTGFLQRYHTRRPMIRTLRYLTGGNPRLLMLLYEVVSQRDLDAPLQLMRRLVDEMTPLYNGLLDRLPTQQQKIVDSLMRLGGTATPAAIAANARLQLNKVTGQLKRLVDAQWLRCEGGGKGREANYSMGDQLFCTWYQLRHFRPQRRRIEVFVDLLRVWFEEQERLSIVQQLLAPETPDLKAGRATSLETAEYFVASLKGTPAEGPAYRQWVDFHTRRESLSRAALAFCELELNRSGPSLAAGEADLHYLRGWAVSHGETTLCQQIERQLAVPADATGDLPAWDAGEGADATAVPTADMLAAYTAVIELPGAPADQRAMAYFYRGITRAQQGDTAGALADYTAVIDLPDAPADQRAKAYFNRGITKGQQGDTAGELADYTAVIDLPDAPAEVRAKALGNLSEVCWRQDERSASLRHAQAALSVMGVEAGTRVEIFTGIAQAVCQGRSESDCRHDVAALCRMAVAGISRDDVETPVRILRGLAVPQLSKSWPLFLEQFCEWLDAPARDRLEMLRPAGDYLRRPDPVILQRLPPQERSFVEELVRSLCAEPEATPDPQSEPVPSPP